MGDHLGARLSCRLMVSTLNAKGGRLKYSCKLCFRDPTPEMTAGYEFPLDKCDVVDRRNLARFRQKRSEWANVLNGDEDHAIWQTLIVMVWREMAFDAIAGIADGNPGTALNNRLVGQAIVDGHVALEVMAIRRLIDETKGVISLARLLRDVRTNREVLTRESFVSFDGLPYDWTRVFDEEWATRGGAAAWEPNRGPRAYGASKRLHEHFDRLAGTGPDQRERTDRIRTELFDRLQEWMEASGAKDLATWSHAYLAHAGDRVSRSQLRDYGVTGDNIRRAISELARVAEALGGIVLGIGSRRGALVAVPQYDPFHFLDRPAMPKEALEVASNRWRATAASYDEILQDVSSSLFGK